MLVLFLTFDVTVFSISNIIFALADENILSPNHLYDSEGNYLGDLDEDEGTESNVVKELGIENNLEEDSPSVEDLIANELDTEIEDQSDDDFSEVKVSDYKDTTKDAVTSKNIIQILNENKEVWSTEFSVPLKVVTEDTVDIDALATDKDGFLYYKGSLFSPSTENVSEDIENLMRIGVTQRLVFDGEVIPDKYLKFKKPKAVNEDPGIYASLLNTLSVRTVEASSNLSSSNLMNNPPHIERIRSVSYGLSTSAQYLVNGQQAFCIEFPVSGPSTGTPYNAPTPYNNDRIKRALFYGWDGPGNIFTNEDQGIVVTTVILSRIYHGNQSGQNLPGYAQLWDLVENGSVPDTDVSFSRPNPTVSVNGGKQVSQTTRFNSDPTNRMTITVPNNVTVVNTTTGQSRTNGSLTIRGGDTIRFEAPLDYNSSYTTGNLRGTLPDYQPIITVSRSGNFQTLGTLRVWEDPSNTARVTVPFTRQNVTMTVRHIDEHTDNVIRTDTSSVTIGSSYSVSPRTNLKIGNHDAVAVTTTRTGTVPSNNFTVNLYYNTWHTLKIDAYDRHSGEFITTRHTSSRKVGANYSVNVANSFKVGDTTYKLDRSSNNVSGTMPRRDRTVNVYYIPYQDITVGWRNRFPNNETFRERKDQVRVGDTYRYTQPLTFTENGLVYERENNNTFSGTLGYRNLTHRFFYRLRRNVTVNYLDNRTGEKLTESKEYQILQGNTYSESPIVIQNNEYTYRFVRHDGDPQNGTIATQNIKINYYYDIPLVKVGLEKLEIYTAAASEGLPVRITLSKENNYPLSLPDMDHAGIDVSLYQGETLIESKQYSARNLPTNIEMTIPPEYLEVNQRKPYTVKLEEFNNNDIDVVPGADAITTDGYTSSEGSFAVNGELNFTFTGIVKTEREVGQNMITYNETVSIDVQEIKRKLTGYGFEYPLELVYDNELGYELSSGFSFNVPESLIDSYLTYPVENNYAKILLEETSLQQMTIGSNLVTTKLYELPIVNIERHTGHLFSVDQVAANDARINYGLLDGGRKFYTPIWDDLNTHSLFAASEEPLGVHKISVTFTDLLEIYASMYGHMDSPTKHEDAIYLIPINSDNPNFPDSWTEEDIQRFHEWNNN